MWCCVYDYWSSPTCTSTDVGIYSTVWVGLGLSGWFPLRLVRGGCVTPFEYLPFYPFIFGYGRWVLGRVLTHRYVYFAGAFVYCFGSLICLGLRGGCLLWGWDPWRAPAGNYLYFGLAGGRLIWGRVVSWAFVAVFAVANPTCLL